MAKLTWFIRRGKRVWAWKEKGKFVKAPMPDWKKKIFRPKKLRRMYRLTAGFNGVAQGEYTSVTYQEFSEGEPGDLAGFKRRARAYIDGQLREQWGDKYHRDWEVWNGPPNYADVQRVPWSSDLIKGGAGPSGWRPDREWRRAYGARMISSGAWFKQQTLEKWGWVLE